MPPSLQLDLFSGATSEHSALVYARLRDVPHFGNRNTFPTKSMLRGSLSGPYCEFSQTLPTTVPFLDVGPGDQPLARALVPDPCCWSPGLPALYRARVELVMDGKVSGQWERPLGIRRFAPRGRSFLFDQQRWVVRGVRQESTTTRDFAAWREAPAAWVVEQPTDESCADASRQGVAIMALVRGSGPDLADQVRRLGQWPAVVLCVIDGDWPTQSSPRRLAPNLTVAQKFAAGDEVTPATWAEAVFVEFQNDVQQAAAGVQNCPLPVVMCRQLDQPVELSRARAGCDELQRELAPFGDFAGYIV